MSFISDLMENIRAAAEATEPYAPIVYGSDPPFDGICMIQGSGFPEEEHLNTGMLYRLPILLNGKNSDQAVLLDALTEIHAALTKTHDYTGLGTQAVQVINIATTASPSIIGREQNRQWIGGSSLEVSFYWR